MDGRKALAPGTPLKLCTRTGYTVYFVRREVGRGGSCIVYDASATDNLGNEKLVRIKECYPRALRICREGDGTLLAADRDHGAFVAAKARLIEAYQKNHVLFCAAELTNAVANTSNLFEANGTVYIVSTWGNGATFADAKIDTLQDCISLVLSTARVLKALHEAGYLYLDLKPENILIIKGSLDLVQLFDFDAMVAIADLEEALHRDDPDALRLAYTRGYAPPEQQTGKLRQIGKPSDLYSLGAVLFTALWRRTPTAFDCGEDAEYDFPAMTYPAANFSDALFRELKTFFHKTLASYPGDRYQDAAEAIDQLKKIVSLSDETKPYLLSSSVPSPVFFTGRTAELEKVSQLLRMPGHPISNVYGMGGIGKSTLIRAWLGAHRSEYDAVLWLYDRGKTVELLCDDLEVHINTIARAQDEPQEEYLVRKLRILAEIASRQRILAVLDNVRQEHLEDLQPLLQVGWNVLLISRVALAEGLYPSFCVEELKPAALATLFARYAHAELRSEEDARDFETIANAVYGHTLTMELLGRQIARSHLTVHEAAELVANAGFRGLPGEKIDCIHDDRAYLAPLIRILDRLVEIDSFTAEEKKLLQILAAVERPGIRVELLRELTSSEMIETVHRLGSCGWLTVAEQRIIFHPLLQEYIRAWPWTAETRGSLDAVLVRLHRKINPDAEQPDLDKQFPEDYRALYELLRVSEQLLTLAEPATPASQLLRFRILMDAPVDLDDRVLRKMLALIDRPELLDARCVLRLYETAAFLLARLERYEDAFAMLKRMKAFLKQHRSRYYTSWYYRAMAVITNNLYGREKDNACLRWENAAIRAAKASHHPDAKRQLAALLLNKAQTLLEKGAGLRRCGDLLWKAASLLERNCPEDDFERYHYHCVAAVYCARNGDEASSLAHLGQATDQAERTGDSPLSFIEHLLDEAAVVYIELGRYDDAVATVSQAIAICDGNEHLRRYREARFDAYLFLGRIYAKGHQYVKAEETYDTAWELADDSRFTLFSPLCPREIRDKALEERQKGADA